MEEIEVRVTISKDKDIEEVNNARYEIDDTADTEDDAKNTLLGLESSAANGQNNTADERNEKSSFKGSVLLSFLKSFFLRC